ncbi:MAG: beta-propeller fold lactonase family protein [Methyloceanibacter sp.]|uniref:beta-propeller fold lactonase family protein n=1 Tax=Methyloceanibacter sp. TaxID=1965321 RepID=UPI003D6DA05A
MALTLVNTDNVFDSDDPDFNINGASAANVLTINGRTFLYVSAAADAGVSVFEVSANGTLTHVDNFADNADTGLAGAQDVITLSVNGQPFVLATGTAENAVNSFVALANGALVHTDTFFDAGDVFRQLEGARDVVAAVVGGNNYAFIAGSADDNGGGIQVVQIANDGTLTFADSVNDVENINLQLNSVENLTTAVVGGTTYLFAAGQLDDGISVFSVAANGVLTNVDNVDDSEDAALRLDGVDSLATAVVAGTTYLYATSVLEDAINVFEVAANGTLTFVSSVDDNATFALDNAFGLTTTKIAGTTYVFAAGENDDGISVFAVAPDGTLVHQTTLFDNVDTALATAFQLSTAVIDGDTFLFVPDFSFDGLSVLRVDVTGLTINGTGGNDIINAFSSAPGQLAPSELGDEINGLGGDDRLEGLGGDDVLTGGNGRGIQLGGQGSDLFNFDAPSETKTGGQRDRIMHFQRGQDDIDLRTIDAKTGVSGNNAFKFIGKDDFSDTKGELRFEDKGSTVIVQGDRNGDGNADFEIFVKVGSLAKGDFLL